MARLPQEPEAFAEQVLHLLKRLHPDLSAELVGPRELVVDGRRLDLENLSRLVSSDEDRGVEIVEQYLEQLFDEETFSVAAMPWDLARMRIMPRIQPVSIFSHLSREQVAHVPFVNGTAVAVKRIGASFAAGGAAPITVALNNIVNTSTGVKEYNVDMASAMMTALPTLLVYVLAGQYFVRGMMAGAVKG